MLPKHLHMIRPLINVYFIAELLLLEVKQNNPTLRPFMPVRMLSGLSIVPKITGPKKTQQLLASAMIWPYLV